MYYICKWLSWLAMRIAFSVRCEGRENIPKGVPLIFASNHRSNADPPLVASAVPKKCAFMAKEELFRNKLFGGLIRMLGAFPVARGKGDMSAIDNSVDALKSGKHLMIFPEGTRSKDGKVGRGHTGAALIAAMADVPVVPVGIVFAGKLHFRSRITIKFGKPIKTSDYCTPSDKPNPRELVKLKKRFMGDIKQLVGDVDEDKEHREAETGE